MERGCIGTGGEGVHRDGWRGGAQGRVERGMHRDVRRREGGERVYVGKGGERVYRDGWRGGVQGRVEMGLHRDGWRGGA